MVHLSPKMNETTKQEKKPPTNVCCNWTYTRIKIYFFLNDGGASAVSPYISLVAKKIGFTTSIVGLVNTLTVIMALIAKPLTGGLIDKFGHHKLMWLLCYVVSLCCTFSIIFIPYLPQVNLSNDISDNNVTLLINKEIGSNMQVCHDLAISNMLETKKHTIPCSAKCYFPFHRDEMCNSYQDCSWLMQFLKPDMADSFFLQSDKNKKKTLAVNFSLTLDLVKINEQHHSCQILMIDDVVIGYQNSFSIPNQNMKLQCKIQCTSATFEVVHSLGSVIQHGYDILKTYQLWWYALVIIIAGVTKRIVEVIHTSVVYGILGSKHKQFGKQKVFGSLGFGFALVVGGLLNEFYQQQRTITNEYASGFYIYAIFLILATGIIGSFHVSPQPRPKHMMQAIGNVMLQFHIIVFFAATIFAGICSSFSHTYSFWYLTERGVTPMYLGLSKGAQCLLAEIPCLYFSGWLTKKIGHIPVIIITFAILGLKFIIYSLMSNMWLVFATEPLEGIFYGLFYPTATSYTSTVAPSGMNTIMQGLFFTAYKGAGRMIGNLIGGFSYDTLGGQATFLTFGIICGVCCLLLAFIQIGLYRRHTASVTISNIKL